MLEYVKRVDSHGCVHLHACKLQCGGTRIHNDT